MSGNWSGDSQRKAKDLRVWHVGPAPHSQGGISTVIRFLTSEQAKIEWIRVDNLSSTVTGGGVEKFLTLLAACLRLILAGLRGRVDLLHVHTSSGVSLRRKSILTGLARVFRIPYILHVHGSNFDKWYEDAPGKQQAWIRKQMDRSAGVVALSESWGRFLGPLTTSPVHVVYNSIPVDEFTWPRPARRPGPPRLLFLGLLGRRKGSYDLLEAVQRVVAARGPGAVELKLGGDGDVAETREMIVRLGLQDQVSYLGWVDPARKAELLADSDLFVLPSYHEGLPMAILEAMAAGVAILTTPINGIPEAVENGLNGVFVQPGDVDGLAAVISELADDPDRLKEMGLAGRWKAEEKFHIRISAANLVSVYQSSLGS